MDHWNTAARSVASPAEVCYVIHYACIGRASEPAVWLYFALPAAGLSRPGWLQPKNNLIIAERFITNTVVFLARLFFFFGYFTRSKNVAIGGNMHVL